MISHALIFFFFFNACIFPVRSQRTSAATAAYTSTDFILLNCGDSGIVNDSSHRSWEGDERSRYVPSNTAVISSPSKAFTMDPSVSSIPYYQTARVFRSPFTYNFPLISPGQKFLRLYFYPNVYSGANSTNSLFDLTANSFTLFRNFSAFLYSKNLSRASFMKEFIITIADRKRLDLIFTPNPNSHAFVNAIEIVSIPDKLYFPWDNLSGVYNLNHNTALENLYRLNVGGVEVDIGNDSGPSRGMFRRWVSDYDYIYFADAGWTTEWEQAPITYTARTPPYTAPHAVYASVRMMSNISLSLEWGFPVDTGFFYLLRFHFCEFTMQVRERNQRVFSIYINNQPADIEVDVIAMAGGPLIPVTADFIKWVPKYGDGGKKDLRLSLVPFRENGPKYFSALLNGLEIFKLNDSSGSFAAANPPIFLAGSPPPSTVGNQPDKSKKGSVFYAVIGGLVGAAAVAAALCFLILRRRKMKDSTSNMTKSSWLPLSTGSKSTARTNRSGASLPSDLCRYFPIHEIKTATRNFDDMFVVGRGGFGKVYKGLIDEACTAVAIKRLNPSSNQGAREFLTEIEMLSKLRHLHLVSLIGYCDDDGEMILIYDYMANGTLRDHLYNSQNTPLSWKQRLQICLGAAKGLHYLHTGAKHAIIHRDVKSTNILLDDKLVAKVSDFGISKVGPAVGGQAHVSTVVKGSFGYVDPEYYRSQQLTLKSDVFSFGVVMLELLCARPPIIQTLPREQANLAEWAKFCFRKGTLEQIIDSNLKDQIARECLNKFVETAVACLKDKGIDRPSMNDIIWSLEFAMQLQASAESSGGDGAVTFVTANTTVPLLSSTSNTTTGEEDTFSRSKSSDFSTSSSERFKSGDAFSELINPSGR